MKDKKAREWTKKALQRGYTPKQIEQTMRQSGQSQETIKEALTEITPLAKEIGRNKPLETVSFHRILLGGGLLLASILIIVLVSFLLAKDKEEIILSQLQEEIVPAIVQLQCLDETGEVATIGSGVYYVENEKYYVDTNSHVAFAADGEFYGCWVYFPWEDGTFYKASYWANEAGSYQNMKSVVDGETMEGIDYAYVRITEPGKQADGSAHPFPPQARSFYEVIEETCNADGKEIRFGDKVYVLGYPGIGEESVTVTEGIISGFLGKHNEWVKTSAGIHPGNSGGIAIGAKTGCLFGIPTLVAYDETGSLGQILTSSFVNRFLDGLQDEPQETETVQSAPGEPKPKDLKIYTSPHGSFQVSLPSEFEIATQEEHALVLKDASREDINALIILTEFRPLDVTEDVVGADQRFQYEETRSFWRNSLTDQKILKEEAENFKGFPPTTLFLYIDQYNNYISSLVGATPEGNLFGISLGVPILEDDAAFEKETSKYADIWGEGLDTLTFKE